METDSVDNIKHWWLFLLRAVLFIALGLYMFIAPLRSYEALSFIFGLVILFAGIAELFHAYANRHAKGWLWRFITGIVDLVLGIIFITHVGVSMAVLPVLLGIWLLFRAFTLFSFASVVRHSLWLVIGGIIAIIFALIIIFNPAVGAMTIVIWTALAFICVGIFQAILAMRLKSANDQLNHSY